MSPDSCLVGSKLQYSARGASRSKQVSRIRVAAAHWNSRSRATAAEGSSTRDSGREDVVGDELDALSMLDDTEKSDAQR